MSLVLLEAGSVAVALPRANPSIALLDKGDLLVHSEERLRRVKTTLLAVCLSRYVTRHSHVSPLRRGVELRFLVVETAPPFRGVRIQVEAL